jgi:hypothetical protein
MEEADALATRVAIISKRLLAIGSTQSLRQKYSNVYKVQLVLTTAPMSSQEEVQKVERWVLQEIANAAFDGESLGGQIKFTIPASFPSNSEEAHDLQEPEISAARATSSRAKSAIVALIEKLEENKDNLGLGHYSVGVPTLERVFISVMREYNVMEEDEMKKRRWGLW